MQMAGMNFQTRSMLESSMQRVLEQGNCCFRIFLLKETYNGR
ncbi:hypothetical protein [uncultured Robinsoniella sp.]